MEFSGGSKGGDLVFDLYKGHVITITELIKEMCVTEFSYPSTSAENLKICRHDAKHVFLYKANQVTVFSFFSAVTNL